MIARTPAPGATGIGTRRAVTATFSEPVTGIDENSFVVRAPNGRRVRGSVTYAGAARTATFKPAKPLLDTSSYTVHLGGAIFDAGANPLAQSDWRFTTVRRAPRASLRGFRLRSRDNDRLPSGPSSPRTATRSAGDRAASGPGRRGGCASPAATPGLPRLVVRLTDPEREHEAPDPRAPAGGVNTIRAWRTVSRSPFERRGQPESR